MLGVFCILLPFHFIVSGFYYMVITVFGTAYAIFSQSSTISDDLRTLRQRIFYHGGCFFARDSSKFSRKFTSDSYESADLFIHIMALTYLGNLLRSQNRSLRPTQPKY